MKLQTLRERLTLILVALLPLHALLVTVLTKLIAGPDHSPLSWLALWKEGLLGLILVFAFIEYILHVRHSGKWRRESGKCCDFIDGLIVALLVLGIVVSTLNSQLFTLNVVFGTKYDFLPLVSFLILRRVSWSTAFVERLMRLLLLEGAVIAAYAILTFFLPYGFFRALGYSALHSLYVPSGALAAFQRIGGMAIDRVQSTMSGPNQLGIWLLIPIAISISKKQKSWFVGLTMTLLFVALMMTFSRSAWIAAAVMLVVAYGRAMRSFFRARELIAAGVVTAALLAYIATQFSGQIVRMSSTRGHFDRPLAALQAMFAHPFGQGLGTAGPATNRTSDACVYLRPEDDPSWAKSQPNLCVFLGNKQVQPTNRVCDCPFLPENWYLQIGVELGWLGFALYLALIATLLVRVYKQSQPVFLVFLGISIAALFLHAWEDAAVAYTAWVLCAISLGYRMPERSQGVRGA